MEMKIIPMLRELVVGWKSARGPLWVEPVQVRQEEPKPSPAEPGARRTQPGRAAWGPGV